MKKPRRTLNLQKLENVIHLEGKVTARCPVCAQEDHDRKGNHLVIFEDWKFNCIRDSAHNRGIWKLAGAKTNFFPASMSHLYRRQIRKGRRMEKERAQREQRAKASLFTLVEKWRWTDEAVWESSPTRPETAVDDPRFFLDAMFRPNDVVWTGYCHQSGKVAHLNRWRTVEEWGEAKDRDIGPYVSPATWASGTFSRSRQNVKTVPYLVLDFDGPSGWKPKAAEELSRHRDSSLAITRWLWEKMNWNLAAIVWTGSKSIHAWFEHPGEDILSPFRETLPILGIDPSLIGHPEHPCRLPGQIHQKTGKPSRVLWLR
jgi:hypothetical protein